jgi:hypothetical protein
MITGAANAEAALLLIDAHEGVQENSRRHGYLLNLLGIRQIAVLVNKMDLENYSESKFKQIEADYRQWLKSIGVEPTVFIPIAAKHGDNIASRSANTPWWNGPTVLETLDQFKLAESPKDQPLRFPIQDVYRFDERRILEVDHDRVPGLEQHRELVLDPPGGVRVVLADEGDDSDRTGLAVQGHGKGRHGFHVVNADRGDPGSGRVVRGGVARGGRREATSAVALARTPGGPRGPLRSRSRRARAASSL